MKLILSPAKRVARRVFPRLPAEKARYEQERSEILRALRALKAWEMERILKTTPAIALDAYLDHEAFDEQAAGYPAMLAFDGLVYRYLAAGDFERGDCLFAREHLRILDGLYGSLRGMDGILPHRLDMAAPLRIAGKSLYAFWADKLYRDLFADGQPVLNLASGEYARCVTPYLKRKDLFITCRFLSAYRGKRKVITAHTKMARGAMARFIIKNRIDNPWDVREFAEMDFTFCEALSDAHTYTFWQG